MQIKVLEVGSPEMKKGPKARYETFVLKYEADGRSRERKMMSFSKDVYPVLKAASAGDLFEITLVKNGEYWDWTAATPVEAVSNGSPAKASGKGGNWETAEERATKQIYIIRQNALTNAVAFVGDNATPEDVISIAQQFADWVTDFDEELGDLDTPSVD